MLLHIADYRGGKNGISAKRTKIQLDMQEVNAMLINLMLTKMRVTWIVGEYIFLVRRFEYSQNRVMIYVDCDGQKEFVLFDLTKGRAFISLYDPSTDTSEYD